MTALAVGGVSKRFGRVTAVAGVSFEVERGEVAVLLGPSGCGKSTLLRLVAGLDAPDGGRIELGGEDATGREPRDRDVAMVFQSYALYPHLTVRENLAFPLRVRRRPPDEVAAEVERAAARLGIQDLLDRKPRELSGGQRQRVAIGRAIVRRPALFLFDEPLSNLDAQLRARMRVELAELFAGLGAAVLYVTHDQVEAMTLGDRILLMHDGRLEQAGAPQAIYDTPATTFAATFIGAPPMNLIGLDAPGGSVPLPAAPPPGAATLGVRPEDLVLDPDGLWPAALERVEPLGAETFVHVRVAGHRLQVRVPGRLPEDRAADLALTPRRLHYFDCAGRRVEA